MKTPPWLFGPLLWDVARYLERLKLAQQFWEFYQDISVLQPAEAASPQNFTAAFDTLCEARSLALGENWQPANLNLAPQALKSIFSSIQMRAPASRNGDAERCYFSPQPLHDEPLRQLSRELADETLKAHFLKFLRELQALKRWNSHQKLDTLLPLIEKYGWCLAPCGLEKETDVPLFALAKMSTAIMASWPRNGDEPPAKPDRQQEIYALICGDISGIQKYIYRISSAKGVAKRLKARSFELAILADAVAKWLLQKFNLPNANLIYSSGGKFYLLAPALAKAEIEAEGEGSINFMLAQKFWEEYNGELFLGLGAVQLRGEDFMADHFGGKWQAVTEACGKPKQKNFIT
jgi:CRISPR-associated protein Csm1